MTGRTAAALPTAPLPTAAPPAPAVRDARIGWLLLPAGGFFVLAFVLPFAVMALFSVLTGNPLQRPGVGFTTRHYARLLDDSLYAEALLETLKLGAVTTVASLLLGYPLALWLVRMTSRTGRTLLAMAVIAPMLTGLVVRTFAWMAILSDQGVVNGTLQRLGLATAPLALMNNELGTLIALVHIYVPFMVLTLAGVLGGIDVRLEEGAQTLGASPWRSFLEVTLPLSMPGVAAGSLLVFALSISAYVTPYLMGGQRVLTLPMLIYQQVSASFNTAFAGALGVVLLAVSILLLAAYQQVLARLGRGAGA